MRLVEAVQPEPCGITKSVWLLDRPCIWLGITRSVKGKPGNLGRFLKPISLIKKQKKKAPKKFRTCVIVLLNYNLWTCVVNFNTSIVILDFRV